MQAALARLGSVLIGCLFVASPVFASHEDSRIGYSVKPPKGWDQVPTKPNETYIVGKFKAGKKQFARNEELGYTYEYQQEMLVLLFLDDSLAPEIEVEGDEVHWEFNPYPDYDSFLKAIASGYYELADPVREDHNGLPVVKREFSAQDGTVRFVTWIFTLDVGEVAVHLTSTEDGFGKAKRDLYRALKSFKAIERTEDIDSLFAAKSFVSIFAMDDLDPEERKIRRQESERDAWARAQEGLPDGWSTLVHKEVPIITHADQKHAKKMADQVRAVLSWLDKAFPEIGEGEYVRTPILRICEDEDEYQSFQRSVSSSGSIEISTFKSTMGSTSMTWESINRGALARWFIDRDRDVYWALPPWLSQGLREMIGVAQPKGSKLDFPVKQWERDFIRYAKSGSITPCRELMSMPWDSYYTQGGDQAARMGESFALTRYFLEGPKKTRSILSDYLVNLRDVVHEFEEAEEARREKDGDKEAETEEEEEEMEAARRKRAEENRQRVLDETLERTFGSWTDRDWDSLEKAYLKSF